MKKFALIILVLIGIGYLICCPSFRENGGEDSVEGYDCVEEGTLVEMEHPVLDQLSAELNPDEIYNDDVIYGYWFKPHEANAVNIFLPEFGISRLKEHKLFSILNIVSFQSLRFVVKEAICSQCCEHIHDEVVDRPVP